MPCFEKRRERPKSALYLKRKKRNVFKTVKGDTLGFLKIQFVAKYQKKLKVTLWCNPKIFNSLTKPKKACGKSLIAPKQLERCDPSTLDWFFRGFGCLQNEVLSIVLDKFLEVCRKESHIST